MAGKRVNSNKTRQEQKERIARTDAYADRVRREYAKSVNDILSLYKRLPTLKEGEMFSFDAESKRIQTEVENALRRLYSSVMTTIHAGIEQEWSKANDAIDSLITNVVGQKALSEPKLAGWFDRNEKAMSAFMNRSDGGLNLSERIWKDVRQLRDEMEVAMSVAIGEGESASQMSRKVRQYLNDPDLMFRRFRYKDEDGVWQTKWKKKVVDSDGKYHFIDYDKDDYKVGRGMYKSSYKNAMRVTRTETNIAYRRADNERWQGLDFVLGQHIETSGSHTDEDKDICDELAGDYPKDFLFDGWHPQCYCICTPILASEKEMENAMDAALEGKDYDLQDSEIDTYPDGFQKFIEENQDALQVAQARGTAPYFIENNMDVVQAIYDGEDLTKPQEPTKEDNSKVEPQEPQRQNTSNAIDYNKENDTIEDYISGERMWINQYLRGDEEVGPLSEEEKQFLDDLTTLTKQEKVKDKALYRAINADAVFGRLTDTQFEDLKNYIIYNDTTYTKGSMERIQSVLDSVDNIITEQGFMSTTRDKEIAQEWGDYTGANHPIVLKIEANESTTGIDIEKYTKIHNPQAEEDDPQKEVLLSLGQRYSISRIYAEEGTIMVDVKLLGEDNTRNIPDEKVKEIMKIAKDVSTDFQSKTESIAREFDAIVSPVNLKSKESIERKLNDKDINGDIEKIYDFVRNTIVVQNNQCTDKVIDKIEQNFTIATKDGEKRIKTQSTPLGYTGTLVNVKLNGIVGEIQINTPQMIYAKDDSAKSLLPKDMFDEISKKSGMKCGLGHKFYEEWRSPETTEERRRAIEEISKKYYEAIRRIKLK